MLNPNIEVLLIEDDPGDIELTQAALTKSKLKINLNTVSDGEEALAYLHQEGEYSQSSRPNLILLDLNLPGLSGREILQAIKSEQQLRHIPVVVLTTSDAEKDVFTSYEFGASCYVNKPIGFKEFMKIVGTIEEFWFTIVTLPQN